MSETKFTPGPWVVRNGSDITNHCGLFICGNYSITETDSANACLIAAAPDMYEALEMAIFEYGKPGGPWNVPSSPGTWIDKAKTALKKARGEK